MPYLEEACSTALRKSPKTIRMFILDPLESCKKTLQTSSMFPTILKVSSIELSKRSIYLILFSDTAELSQCAFLEEIILFRVQFGVIIKLE